MAPQVVTTTHGITSGDNDVKTTIPWFQREKKTTIILWQRTYLRISRTFQWCRYHSKLGYEYLLTHRGLVARVYTSVTQAVICSDNDVYSERRQAIIRSNADILSTEQSGRSPKVVALFQLQTLVAILHDYFICIIQSQWNQFIHESTIIMII